MNEGAPISVFEYTPATTGLPEVKFDSIINSYEKGPDGKFSADQLSKMRVDITFSQLHPDLPLENASSRWDNYSPQNQSQTDLTRMMERLLQTADGKLAGMFVHGDPGVGKTHLSVAFAKKAIAEGKKSMYINLAELKGLGNEILRQEFDVLIIDDWNSEYGSGSAFVRKAITLMHNKGGRLFITSNTQDPKSFLKSGLSFAGDTSETMRLIDRAKGGLLIQEVRGSSQRSSNTWWDEPKQLKP